MITLDTFIFPATAHGLRWSDEFSWSPVAQATEYGLTGALLVQESTRQTGRPLTLTGGRAWAWLARADLLTLQALLDATTQRTLTLHDGRQIPVIPRREGDGPLSASALPLVGDSGPADPSAETYYVLDALRFLIVGDITTPPSA
jgi:hypothetical protein